MRRVIVGSLILLVVAALSVLLYFDGKELEIRLAEAQLQEKLGERLPIEKRYFIIFEVVLDNPRIDLVDGSNRVDAGLDLTLNIRLGSQSLPVGGRVDASGGIRYNSETGEFFLTDPVVENLAVQGIPERYTDRTKEVLTLALAEYYSDRSIYTLNRADLKQAATKLVLKNVVIENQELVVTLGI